MANARRVTEAEALGEVDQTSNLSKKYSPSLCPILYIPPTILDDIRIEAHFGSTYRNSHEEEQVLRAVDDAISKRVQRAAYANAERAMHLLETEEKPAMVGPRSKPNALARAKGHLEELSKIRSELRRGKTPTADLAERYEKVRMAIQNGDGHSLVVLNSKATSLRDKLADPAAAVSRTLSLMPASAWRPLGIRHW